MFREKRMSAPLGLEPRRAAIVGGDERRAFGMSPPSRRSAPDDLDALIEKVDPRTSA